MRVLGAMGSYFLCQRTVFTNRRVSRIGGYNASSHILLHYSAGFVTLLPSSHALCDE